MAIDDKKQFRTEAQEWYIDNRLITRVTKPLMALEQVAIRVSHASQIFVLVQKIKTPCLSTTHKDKETCITVLI